jgi:flagellar biosynthesis protein FlhB
MMYLKEINYLAVLVCGVANMVVGFLWYGIFFSKTWISLVNKTEEEKEKMKKDAPKAYTISFIISLVVALVLAYIVQGMNLKGIVGGVMLGFWLWLGVAMAFRFNDVLFEKRPFKLFLVNTGFDLSVLIVMGIILTLWR